MARNRRLNLAGKLPPRGAMDPTTAATLAAVLRIYQAEGRVTVRAVARTLGCSPQTVHSCLRVLRAEGLVGFADGTGHGGGTLHPTLMVLGPVHPLPPRPRRRWWQRALPESYDDGCDRPGDYG